MTCPNCTSVRINEKICHEHGCPTPDYGKKLECANCGTKFQKQNKEPLTGRNSISKIYFCSKSCQTSYFS